MTWTRTRSSPQMGSPWRMPDTNSSLAGAGSFVGIITAIIGLVLGSSAKKLLPPEERGMASAGFVCSLIALILSALVALVLLLLGGTVGALMMMR